MLVKRGFKEGYQVSGIFSIITYVYENRVDQIYCGSQQTIYEFNNTTDFPSPNLFYCSYNFDVTSVSTRLLRIVLNTQSTEYSIQVCFISISELFSSQRIADNWLNMPVRVVFIDVSQMYSKPGTHISPDFRREFWCLQISQIANNFFEGFTEK